MRVPRHALAICLLPGTVVVLVPALIVWQSGSVSVGWGLPNGLALVPVALGTALLAVGVSLVVSESGLPPPPVPFAVWIAWSDGAGDHERRPAGLTVST